MKKTRIVALLPLIALVAGCGKVSEETDNSNSATGTTTETVSTSQTSTSDAPATLFAGHPTSVSALAAYIGDNASDIELLDAVSYEHHSMEDSLNQLGGRTIRSIDETATAYSNHVLLGEGVSTQSINDMYIEEPTVTESKYRTFIGIVDDTFYSISDYEGGKDDDRLTKVAVTNDNRVFATKAAAVGMTSTFLTSYEYYVKSRIVEGFDEIEPTLTKDDLTTYTYATVLTNTSSELTTVDFKASFDQEGRFVSYEFNYIDYDVSGGKKDITAQTKDAATITYGTKVNYDFTGMNPVNYLMTDYSVGFESDDGTYVKWDAVEGTTLPYDMYIRAKARNETPSTAIDTKLYITASSDPSVVSVRYGTSDDGSVYSSAKAIKEGSTTLTIMSEGGIEKTVDVTVVAPALKSLEAKIYGHALYAGDRETIYISKNPGNSLDELTATSSDESVATVEYDASKDMFYANLLKEGDFTLTFTSRKDPSVTYTTQSYHVYGEKLTTEQVRDLLPGTWHTDAMFDSWIYTADGKTEVSHPLDLVLTEYREVTTGKTTAMQGTGKVTFDTDWTRLPFDKDTSIEFTYSDEQGAGVAFMDRVVYTIDTFTYTDKKGDSYVFGGQLQVYLNGDMELVIGPGDDEGDYSVLTMRGFVSKVAA